MIPILGTQLGGFRLEALLGSGAMGDVYRARDLKLQRDVAVKVLRPEVAADPERLRRFAREARSASALNHPNIVHVYDVGLSPEAPYIAMELVRGKTLRELIERGPVGERQLVDLAAQLAAGLAKAHAGGIVHRDLKPENLIVTDDGYLKILDFGLAKLLVGPNLEAPSMATRTGAIIGTAGYMSPEQARGQKADARSDQFSLGLILYEMATGERAFDGDSVAETLVAIIRTEPPPIERVNPSVPLAFRGITRRCLSKVADGRYESTEDLARELREVRDRSLSGAGEWTSPLTSRELPAAEVPPSASRLKRVWPLATLMILLFVAWGWLPHRNHAPAKGMGQMRLLAAAQGPTERIFAPSLSRDGKMVTWVGAWEDQVDLYVGRVAGGARLKLTDDGDSERNPVFAPNGEEIAFSRRAAGEADPEICLVPTLGGNVRCILSGGAMPAWSADGQRLAFIRERSGYPRALATVAADGSDPRVVLEGDGDFPFLYSPAWSPDGRLLAVRRSRGGLAGEIWLVPLNGEAPRALADGSPSVFAHRPTFTPDGQEILVSSNRAGATNLWLLPIDGGEPRPLTSGAGPDVGPSMSLDGSVAFLNARWLHNLWLIDLENGSRRALAQHGSHLWAPTFSPDGLEVTFSRAEADGAWHLWTQALAGGAARRLTAGSDGEIYPRYLPTGEELIFNGWSGAPMISRLPRGGGASEPLIADAAWGDVSADGRFLAFARREGGTEKVFVATLPGGETRLLTSSPSTVPRWSPDGRFLVFSPDRGFKGGLFVIGAAGEGERRLTQEGGWPVWWPDGSKIGYAVAGADGDQELWTVPFPDGEPSRLASLDFEGGNHLFDISPDGRFLVASNSMPLLDEIWLLRPGSRDESKPLE